MSLTHYLSNKINPDICDIFKAAAKDTWARIQFSRTTPRLRIHETTITQNLVYEMRLLQEEFHHLDYTLYESTNEAAHGDDLELCIMQPGGSVVTFAIQAKIIHHRGKSPSQLKDGIYKNLKHTVGKGAAKRNQVDLLLDYSRLNGFIPIYLLYNYVLSPAHPPADQPLQGCTVISAVLLKKEFPRADGGLRDNVKYSDLHPTHAIAWHELVCSQLGSRPDKIKEDFELPKTHLITLKTVAEINRESQWRELRINEPASFEASASQGEEVSAGRFFSDDLQRSDEIKVAEFLPKFRIFIDPANRK